MHQEWPQRLKRLLFNLFYPAVLGTFLVSLLPAVEVSIRQGLDFSVAPDWKLIVCLLIVAHFIVDYIFTEEVKFYKASLFLLDLVVVTLLYAAYQSVHLGDGAILGRRTVALTMAGVYGCFLLWEYLSRDEIGSQPVMTTYEAASALLFLGVGIFPNVVALALALAAATLAMVIICGRVLRQYHSRRESTLRTPGKTAKLS